MGHGTTRLQALSNYRLNRAGYGKGRGHFLLKFLMPMTAWGKCNCCVHQSNNLFCLYQWSIDGNITRQNEVKNVLCSTVVGKFDSITTKVPKPSFVKQVRSCEKEWLTSMVDVIFASKAMK